MAGKIIGRKRELEQLNTIFSSDKAELVAVKYSRELRERCATFKSVTKTRRSLHTTLITPCGLKQNANTAVISQTIVLDNLFDYKS